MARHPMPAPRLVKTACRQSAEGQKCPCGLSQSALQRPVRLFHPGQQRLRRPARPLLFCRLIPVQKKGRTPLRQRPQGCPASVCPAAPVRYDPDQADVHLPTISTIQVLHSFFTGRKFRRWRWSHTARWSGRFGSPSDCTRKFAIASAKNQSYIGSMRLLFVSLFAGLPLLRIWKAVSADFRSGGARKPAGVTCHTS